MNEIVHGDYADIDACDLILAMCQRPSWGTAMEIHYARSKNKPVFSVIGLGTDTVSPWLAYHSTRLFGTLGQAIDAIEDMER